MTLPNRTACVQSGKTSLPGREGILDHTRVGRSTSGLTHPFWSVIKRCNLDHLCIAYTTVDMQLESLYMMPRVVTNAEHLSREDSIDQYTFLKFALRKLLQVNFSAPMSDLVKTWPQVKTITLHNVSSQHLPRVRHIRYRIFHCPCPCRNNEILDPEILDSCYTHWKFDDRLAEIRSMMSVRNKGTESWEFVDYVWTDGGIEHYEAADGMVEAFWRWFFAEELEGEWLIRDARPGMSFTSSRETDPCVCCGKKQLRYSAVSRGRITGYSRLILHVTDIRWTNLMRRSSACCLAALSSVPRIFELAAAGTFSECSDETIMEPNHLLDIAVL